MDDRERKRQPDSRVRRLTIQIRELPTVEESCALLANHPDVTPDEVTVGTIVNKARGVAKSKNVLAWFEAKYPDMMPDEATMNSIANKARNVTEAKGVLAWFETKYPGVMPNEKTMGTIINKVRDTAEAKDVLAWFEAKYPNVMPNAVTTNSIVNKTQSVVEAKDVLAWFEANYRSVTPDEVTMNSIVNKTQSVVEAKDVLAWFKAKYPGVMPNEKTMGATANKAQSVKEAKDVLAWFETKYPGVIPDEVTMNILYNKLIRFREGGKVNTDALSYVESLIKKAPELAQKIEDDPKTLIVRAICHFAADQTQKGIEYVQKVFKSSKVNRWDIERTAIACFAFLPPQHPLNQINRQVLTQHRLHHIIQSAEEYARTFWDVYARWEAEYREELKAHFGGGENVFARPHIPRPIDSKAKAVTDARRRDDV